MPVETDAAMRAARETVMENSLWIGPLQQRWGASSSARSICWTGC